VSSTAANLHFSTSDNPIRADKLSAAADDSQFSASELLAGAVERQIITGERVKCRSRRLNNRQQQRWLIGSEQTANERALLSICTVPTYSFKQLQITAISM